MAGVDCDVAVLCGGLGTRLRSILAERPKPMALVKGRPFLDILVDYLIAQGCRRVIFCAGYKSEWITTHFRHDTRFEGVYSVESSPLGTAGALAQCRWSIHTSTLLVCNGDSFCDIALARLLEEHRESGCAATIALVPSDGRFDGGAVSIDALRRVQRFTERGHARYLNAGLYAIQTDVLDAVPLHAPCSLEHDVFPRLVPQGVHGFVAHTPVHDIGTPERLRAFRSTYSTLGIDDAHTIQGGEE